MTEKSLINADFSFLDENYNRITDNIANAALKSGRKPEEVRLMAVTKTVNPIYINHVIGLGVGLIGENRVQELLGKIEFLNTENTDIHMIGHLQSNKVKKILGVVSMIESVDSGALAAEISRQTVMRGGKTDILLEINIGGEETKTGIAVDLLYAVTDEIAELPGVNIRGLMCMPPICKNETQARKYFEKTKIFYEDLSSRLKGKAELSVLSMGTSVDYIPAILEGANLVRIGSLLFGARKY